MFPAELKNFPLLFSASRLNTILFRFSILLLLVTWIFGFLAPILFQAYNPVYQYLLDRFYSTMCHQDAEKCILIKNESMLVCARCAGIYIGAFIRGLVSLIRKQFKINLSTIIIMALPLLADVFLTATGIYVYSQIRAFITGLIFGSMVYIIIISELENLLFTRGVRGNE